MSNVILLPKRGSGKRVSAGERGNGEIFEVYLEVLFVA